MRRLIRTEGIDAVHGEKLNEPRAGTMDPALDRSYRALADGGGLLVGEARRADENERFALARQELRERPADFLEFQSAVLLGRRFQATDVTAVGVLRLRGDACGIPNGTGCGGW